MAIDIMDIPRRISANNQLVASAVPSWHQPIYVDHTKRKNVIGAPNDDVWLWNDQCFSPQVLDAC